MTKTKYQQGDIVLVSGMLRRRVLSNEPAHMRGIEEYRDTVDWTQVPFLYERTVMVLGRTVKQTGYFFNYFVESSGWQSQNWLTVTGTVPAVMVMPVDESGRYRKPYPVHPDQVIGYED
jgi:hypothetical protein